MQTSQDHALLLEALSDKVLHQLPQAVWTHLFLGAERDSIRFEQRNLTLVHADADLPAAQAGGATERFYQELQRLNIRHGGRLDPYVDATALVTFEEAGSAVRMAMELQGASGDLPLRIGVVSGPCTLAFFRAQGRLWCTPLGSQPARAAEVAATAKPGGIVISPEACDPAQRPARPREDPRAAEDFRDSEMDLSTLAGSTHLRSVDILLA